MTTYSYALYPLTAMAGFLLALLIRQRFVLQLAIPRFNGEDITNGLRAFNQWRDDFLIELSTLLLMVGFIIGTVDVLSSDGLSRLPLFNDAWAIVQAVAIDGLFFAVWGKIRRTKWAGYAGFWAGLRGYTCNIMLSLVGLLLSFVAAMVNGLLSYQQINNISDIAVAMSNLGIDEQTFSYIRAGLVVIVAVLVALFARNYEPSGLKAITDKLEATQKRVAQLEEENARLQEMNDSLDEQLRASRSRGKRSPEKAIESVPARAMVAQHAGQNSPQDSPEKATDDNEATGYVAADNGYSIAIGNAEGATIIATGPHRERIKQAMLRGIAEGQELDYKDIAQIAQVGYSTVKKWAPEIRQEISSDKLTITMQLLREKPDITDEELCNHLTLKRAASARFWRLKAEELMKEGVSSPFEASESDPQTDEIEVLSQ
jgi:hypothetical protein